MIPLSKYQDNPAPASAKAGASPSRSLVRNWCRIEEYLEKEIIRKMNEKINLYLITRGQEMGSRKYCLRILPAAEKEYNTLERIRSGECGGSY